MKYKYIKTHSVHLFTNFVTKPYSIQEVFIYDKIVLIDFSSVSINSTDFCMDS